MIDADIRSGAFAVNPTLAQCIDHVTRVERDASSHGLALRRPGAQFSITHLFAMIDAAVEASVPFAIHAFLDGRDMPPRSARTYIEALESQTRIASGAPGSIASICGRFYAMDRDKRWERTDAAFTMLVRGQAQHHEPTALAGLDAAYARDEKRRIRRARRSSAPRAT